jgi:hypothetical protein
LIRYLLNTLVMCKDEWTGKSLLDPAAVPETLGATRADVVGNYALLQRLRPKVLPRSGFVQCNLMVVSIV